MQEPELAETKDRNRETDSHCGIRQLGATRVVVEHAGAGTYMGQAGVHVRTRYRCIASGTRRVAVVFTTHLTSHMVLQPRVSRK
jgi:hypothetical protein